MIENDILEIQTQSQLYTAKPRILEDCEIQFRVKNYSGGSWKTLTNDEIRQIAGSDSEALIFLEHFTDFLEY
jgi:hypothetical protein